jgi:hypothetical protein
MTPRTAAGRRRYAATPVLLPDILAIEAEAAAPLRDALRGLVEAWDADQRVDGASRGTEESGIALNAALDTARRALDEPIEPVLDREVEG